MFTHYSALVQMLLTGIPRRSLFHRIESKFTEKEFYMSFSRTHFHNEMRKHWF